MKVNGPYAKNFEKEPNILMECQKKRTHITTFSTRRQHIIEIANAIQRGLCPYFQKVDVSVVECPNLSRKPFDLPKSGISGENTIAVVGSVDYLLPGVNSTKQYDLMEVVKATKIRSGEIIGGGTGPYPTTGRACEMTAELCFCNGKVMCNRTLHGYCSKNSNVLEATEAVDTKFSSLAQLFATEGNEGKVIQVLASRRRCEGGIGKFIHNALKEEFGRGPAPLALGGVFLLENSGVKYHVLSELPHEPFHTFPDLQNYLRFFEMKSPVIGVGTCFSHDPENLGIAMEEFHVFNETRTLAGHYQTDTDPEVASYRMYLHPVSHICRIDKPVY